MRALTTLVAIAAAYALPVQARQSASPAEAVIDTVIVLTSNIFSDDEARSNIGFRLSNGIHATTRPGVVRRELLFKAGDVYDSATVAETERNLRSLGIFREVLIDSVRVEGRLAVLVRTFDSWSLQLNLTGRTTGSTFTWAVGIAERNFLGTGNLAGVSYRKDPDRNAFTAVTRINRLFSSRITTSGFYEDLSDGRRGGWLVGYPFRSFSDRRALEISGERGDHRVLQFRTPIETQNVVAFQRRFFLNRIAGAYAPMAETGRYLRVGGWGQVRREEILLRSDRALSIPDTVTGAVGVFAEYRRANFKVVTHFNGFALREDLDLSTILFASTWLAPSAFGYERTGVGPSFFASTGASIPSGFVRMSAVANGLFTSAGLDSGRVQGSFTIGRQLVERQATFVHLRAGTMKRPAPGREFDLGHGIGPRSFGPHAFTGDRNVWGTFEHRMFLVDEFLQLVGLGFAAFVDYGGAWFDGDEPRFGGNAGFGLRVGQTRASGANITRVDLAYQFGDGFTGRRWKVSTGRGFAF